jgi:hypothetical protein
MHVGAVFGQKQPFATGKFPVPACVADASVGLRNGKCAAEPIYGTYCRQKRSVDFSVYVGPVILSLLAENA